MGNGIKYNHIILRGPFKIFFSSLIYVSVIKGNKNDLPLEPWHATGKAKL